MFRRIYLVMVFVLTGLAVGWTVYGTASYFHDKRKLRSTRICLKNEITKLENSLRPGAKAATSDKRFLFNASEMRQFEIACKARVLNPNISEGGLFNLRPDAAGNDFEPISIWMSKEPNLFDMTLLGTVAGVAALLLAFLRIIAESKVKNVITLFAFLVILETRASAETRSGFRDSDGKEIPELSGEWTSLSGFFGKLMPAQIIVSKREFSDGNSKFNCGTSTVFLNPKVTNAGLMKSLVVHEGSHIALCEATRRFNLNEQSRFWDEGLATILEYRVLAWISTDRSSSNNSPTI